MEALASGALSSTSADAPFIVKIIHTYFKTRLEGQDNTRMGHRPRP